MSDWANGSKSSSSFQGTTASRVLAALAGFHLKQIHPNQYRCNSPLRPGSDSHGFMLIVDPDGEHGAYFDHAHEEDHGSLYDLAARLGVVASIPNAPRLRQSIESTKRVYRGLGDYAQAHGLTAAQFVAAGWSETMHQGRPALAFITQTGTRYRFLDGEKPIYKSQVGYQCCWYGLQRAVQLAQETGQALVICNGEASTVVGQHMGVAACAVTGGEKKRLPPHLLEELKAAYSGRVLVAFDCLDQGARAAPRLAAQLTEADLDARAIDLGLGKGGDVADFCRLHGDKAITTLNKLPDVADEPPTMVTSSPMSSSRWQWLHADQLDTLPPTRWLIPDEIPEQALVVLFGPSGAGKSFIALDYSLQVAQHAAVLYIAAEGYNGYANRKIAWCKHHQCGAGHLYFPADNAVIDLLNPQVVQDFIASVMPLQPKLIVFDTLAWCMTSGDENSASDMQRLLTHCRQLQTALGATVLLVHHTGKTGATERGSSALRGGADVMIEITNDDEIITLSCSKSKETEGFPDRHLARVTVETRPGETSCVWLPTEKVMRSKSDRLTRPQHAVLELLNAPLFISVGARFSQLADALPDISRSGLYKILNRLMDSRLGYITQGKRGEPFTITEVGQAALSTATNVSMSAESPLSIPSLRMSTETPSLPSTLSTPPVGGRQRLDVDTGRQPEITAQDLTDAEYEMLQRWSDVSRAAPGDFRPAQQVFLNSEPTRLHMLAQLSDQGYLERQPSLAHHYRLSAAGWAAFGLRLTHIDLNTY